MPAWRFDGPGHLKDFTDPARWHEAMQEESQGIVAILVETALGRPAASQAEFRATAATLTYVDPTTTSPPDDAETVAVAPWPAFPRAVERRAPWTGFPPDPVDLDGSYRAAEHLGDEDHRAGTFVDGDGAALQLPVRDRQDEYCEWAVRRDGQGRITRATFVAEGYDYFSKLFEHDEQRVVDIYREFTGIAALKADDLRAPRGVYRQTNAGRYTVAAPGAFNPRNRHNIDPGIVHLSHRANSLGAEVNLAGVSGIARVDAKGALVDGKDAERLLCCAEGGNPNRNSDPLIAQQAYAQVLAGYHYTLANPVGLYIADVEHDGLRLPDGEAAPAEWWRVLRGTGDDHRVLRVELQVPASEGLTISDLNIDGEPIRFGGQLAELLTVHLFVTRWRRAAAGYGPEARCSATCCRKGPVLVLSAGSCPPGFTLAFPHLVGAAAPHGLVAPEAAPVDAPPSRSHGRRLP